MVSKRDQLAEYTFGLPASTQENIFRRIHRMLGLLFWSNTALSVPDNVNARLSTERVSDWALHDGRMIPTTSS